MNNKEIRIELEKLADEKYKKFHSSLCPNSSEIMGVKVPDLRKLAKEIVKTTDVEEYLKNASDDTYEERLLQGMVIGLWKTDIKNSLKALEKFLPKIDSWAICDITAAGLKFAKKNQMIMWIFITTLLTSEKEFIVRFAIVMMLDHFINDEYIDRVLEKISITRREEYYIKMAVAWAFQVAYIKYPEKTMNVLVNSRIDDWTYNKALQKIIESYRVDDKTKEEIRKMKR